MSFGVEWGRFDGKTGGLLVSSTGALERLVGAVLVALLLALSLTAAPTGVTGPGPDVSVIVRAVPGSVEAAERLVTRLGGTVGRRLGIIDGFSARLPERQVPRVSATPVVTAVTPDTRGRLLAVDPVLGYDPVADFGSPSNVAAVTNATTAHSAGITGRGVDIALIDSGVVPVDGLTTPGKVVNGADLSFDSQAANLRYLDGFGHGTHMAGLIAGRDSAAVGPSDPAHFTGMAPDARILNVKVGAHDGAADVSQVIAAIDWVVQHRYDNGMNVRVLNLAFGTDSTQDYTLDPLAYAAEVAWRKGIVVVVAGGNDGKSANSLANPAIDPFLLAVGATDPMGTVATSDDTVADFSSRGNRTRHVDVVAPGKSLISLRAPNSLIDVNFPGGRVGTRFFRGSGTSQAAAVTAGAVALLLQQRPGLTPDAVKALFKSTADPVKATTTTLTGSGTINVAKVLAAPTPTNASQTFAYSTGSGSIDTARGSARVVDPLTGVAISGEQDIMGQRWNGSQWAKKAWNGSSWSGGTWNGSSWSGSSWSGSSWSGSSWSGSSWSGSSWSGSSWSGSSWSGSSWS